jgi:hypothetical protein
MLGNRKTYWELGVKERVEASARFWERLFWVWGLTHSWPGIMLRPAP